MSHIPPKGIVSSKVHSSKRFSSLKSLNIDLGYIKVGDVADSKCLIEDVFGDGEAYRAVGYLLMDSPSPATDTQLSHVFIHHRTGWCVWEITEWYLSLYQILQVSAYERFWD